MSQSLELSDYFLVMSFHILLSMICPVNCKFCLKAWLRIFLIVLARAVNSWHGVFPVLCLVILFKRLVNSACQIMPLQQYILPFRLRGRISIDALVSLFWNFSK